MPSTTERKTIFRPIERYCNTCNGGTMQEPQPQIGLRLSNEGIEAVYVSYDSADEMKAGHLCLARVSGELQALDAALKSGDKV